jgi:hypothetical protein
LDNPTPLVHEPLYQHSKRPQWGLAILAEESATTRSYQFQDGQLRTIKEGYYHLIEQVNRPIDRVEPLLRDLKNRLRLAGVRRNESPAAAKSRANAIPFDDQLTAFAALYPEGGFDSPEWIEGHRTPKGRAVKRHREPAIAKANEVLSSEALKPLVDKGDWKGVQAAFLEVLKATDLVGSKDGTALRKLDDETLPAFGEALLALVESTDENVAERFAGFVVALEGSGERPSWPLVTAPLALLHPHRHVAVKPTAFRAQARWLAPNLTYDPRPSYALYERFYRLAEAVKERLVAAGHTPRDLLDIRDFIGESLKAAKKDN